jgi:ferric-dicitrate binding protein FerR (iron transport regulator)
MAGCSPTHECLAVTFQTMNKPTNIPKSVRSQAFDWYAAIRSPRQAELWPSFEEWLKNPQHKEMYLWIEEICADARDLAESCEASSDYQPTLNVRARRHSRRS